MTTLRFFGVAAYTLTLPDGKVVLIDPFLDENPASPIKSGELERVDVILVTHAAYDHLGDTEKIARRLGCPVVCGGEVKAYLVALGIPKEQVRATTWGIRVKVAGIEIQPVKCEHWSLMTMPDGSIVTGNPMAFVIDCEPNVRFYHYGDTALFSDMKLQAALYRPTHGAIGIANPQEILSRNPMPGEMLTGEMSPREGVLASQWLGLKTVFPCHYCTLDGDPDVLEFQRELALTKERGETVPESVLLRAGDSYELS
jgi:L-ascorbate metabolism protein UlaG (beta-lactamase superfamily)